MFLSKFFHLIIKFIYYQCYILPFFFKNGAKLFIVIILFHEFVIELIFELLNCLKYFFQFVSIHKVLVNKLKEIIFIYFVYEFKSESFTVELWGDVHLHFYNLLINLLNLIKILYLIFNNYYFFTKVPLHIIHSLGKLIQGKLKGI